VTVGAEQGSGTLGDEPQSVPSPRPVAATSTTPLESGWRVVELSEVGNAVADVHVEPALLRSASDEFVSFFGSDRRLRVARRSGGGPWWTTVLEERIGWDSHNGVSIGLDRDGYVHLAGNMHAVPLLYYRSRKPRESGTLVREPGMVVARLERRVTYPKFFHGPGGSLWFAFRNGVSGAGDCELYEYQEALRRWTRPLERPLVDGEEKRSAYIDRGTPRRGPDGRYHLVWVWRDTPDAVSCHTLSYARSEDLLTWTTGGGERLDAPLRLDACDVIDPVPTGGGMINNNVRLGFDALGRPTVAYHRRDAGGRIQVHVGRLEDAGQWRCVQATDWDVEWAFEGLGSLPFEVEIGAPRAAGAGLAIDVRVRQDLWRIELDDVLATTGIRRLEDPFSELSEAEGDDGLFSYVVREAADGGDPRDASVVLWRSVRAARDRAPLHVPPAQRVVVARLLRDPDEA